MKKERPILFSTPMVQAIMSGNKTQTRRVVKPQPDEDGLARHIERQWEDTSSKSYKCPYGKPGDVLWVREQHYVFGEWEHNGATPTGKQKWTFKRHIDVDVMFTEPGTVMPNTYRKPAWYKRTSLFMKKDVTRIWLEITDVRIERLQDITERDVIREGTYYILNVQAWFSDLWSSINGADSWKANPWVWVVEFKRIERT
jgi:hypothetical protein